MSKGALASLEELWLSDNAIASADDLAPLSSLRRLQTIRLSGCPVAALPGYRESVRKHGPPSLSQLDADPIGVTPMLMRA